MTPLEYFNNLNIDYNTLLNNNIKFNINDFIDIEFIMPDNSMYKLKNQIIASIDYDLISIDLNVIFEQTIFTKEDLYVSDRVFKVNRFNKNTCSFSDFYKKRLIEDAIEDAHYLFTNEYDPEMYYSQWLDLQKCYELKLRLFNE